MNVNVKHKGQNTNTIHKFKPQPQILTSSPSPGWAWPSSAPACLWIFVNFCEFLGLNIGQLRRPISRAIWGLERCSRGLRKCTRDADFKNTLLFDVWPQEACENWQNIWVTCRFCPDPTSNDLVSPSSLRSLGEINLWRTDIAIWSNTFPTE